MPMVLRKHRSASLSLIPALAAISAVVGSSEKCSWIYWIICFVRSVLRRIRSEGGEASAGRWEKSRKRSQEREERTWNS